MLSKQLPVNLKEEYLEILDRLEKDEPLQYVVGETEFRNCRIICKPGVLIPRPETEELVDLVLQEANNILNPKILDLCTGTGCIAISVAQELQDSQIFGLDVFKEVIDLASENNSINKTDVKFSRVDVLSSIEMIEVETEDFDIWVSNPPYIPTKEKERMEDNVLDFEPGEALFVPDEDPLLFYRQIAISAQKGLKKNGFLFYEVHEDFAQETINLLSDLKFENLAIHKDLQGKNRMISAQKV